MNTPLRALAVLLLLAAVAQAADPQKPPVDTTFLKQYAETRGFTLGRPQKPKFAPDGKTVLFLRADPKAPKMKLFEFTVESGKTKELLSPEMLLKGAEENLTPEEKARRERQRVSVGGFTDFHFDKDGKNVLVMLAGKLYVFDRATAKATELKTGEGGAIVDPKWSPDGTKVAYVRGFDVYVYDLSTGKESAVTTGGTAIKTHGLAEFVAQEEMGRHSGYWWSPDGKHIAYEEADHTGVETWYVADPLKPDAKPSEQFYPRPGKKNVAVKLGIIPVTGGETVWVEWDRKKYEYLAAVKWDKLGGLTVQLQDRKQRTTALYRVQPETGELKLLLDDFATTGTWVNLRGSFPRWLDANRFLWITEVDGDARLALFDLTDAPEKPARRVTPPGLQVVDIVGLWEKSGGLIVQATDDPSQMKLWAVGTNRPDGSAIAQINRSGSQGICTAVYSEELDVSVQTTTTLEQMPRSVVKNVNDSLGELPSVAIEPPFKPNVKVEKVGDYWTAAVRPKDFDPKKKYPVIVDVYGGPKHLHVVQAMRNWLVPQWLADQGFIVVAIDNRGTPGRGREWERAIYQKFGTVPLEDQVKGLHALCDRFPELDRDRVGIVGWSFGGYMAANGVLRRPDVFKAAVAGAPVTDWEDYDTHYTERYMGLLPESKKAYDEASLIPLAKDLKRPLLLVHGTADDNVYYRHTLKLSDALFRAGRDFESLALPGVTHMYSADPTVMERLWAKSATFFKTHLGEPK
jgi:dipeptidyl-peptidase-4